MSNRSPVTRLLRSACLIGTLFSLFFAHSQQPQPKETPQAGTPPVAPTPQSEATPQTAEPQATPPQQPEATPQTAAPPAAPTPQPEKTPQTVVPSDGAASQPNLPTANPEPAQTEEQPYGPKKNDRIFGVIPNYRTVEDEAREPSKVSAGEKIKLGLEDSFDYYAYPAAGIFAGIGMWQHQTPSFGQGAAGFGRYYGTAFADQTIGNMMSESIFPIMLRQDPRYFPMAEGGFGKRTWYAISREWITRNDNGKNGFNYSELGGNAAAVAISNAYYPAENHTVSNNAYKYGQQIGLDAFFNILKEFWPDMRRKMFGK